MLIKLKVASDNGNSGHDIYINNEYWHQPNVYSKINHLQTDFKAFLMMDPKAVLEKIQEHLVVTILSPTLQGNCNGTFAIGFFPIQNGMPLKEFDIEDSFKSTSPLPIINTLGVVAAKAVQKYIEENQNLPEEELETEVELSTALPIKEHTNDVKNRLTFWASFYHGPHTVQLHLGRKTITIKVSFTKIAVLGEAQCAVHGLIKNVDGTYRNDDIFEGFYKFNKKLGAEGKMDKTLLPATDVDGKYFEDKRILHADIGSGTTETPITNGVEPDPMFSKGHRLGVGQAVNLAIDAVGEVVRNEKIKRQEVEMYIRNEKSYHHEDAISLTKGNLQDEMELVVDKIKTELHRTRNNRADVVMVYGGGSILMKDMLFDRLLELALEYEVDLFYVDKKYAVTLNAQGLNVMVHSKLFSAVAAAFKERGEEFLKALA